MIGKSIIAVSDVHLGMTIGKDKSDEEKYRESQFRDFLDTLDFSKISDFILLGDILDFWRHDHLNVIVDESSHVDKLKELKNKHTETNFHYIAGNHDYHLLWLKENGADYPIDIKKSVEIKSKDEVFYFTHGYQLEVLSWSLYKSLSLYEEFCEEMCLVGEEGSRFADNLWKHYLKKITYGVNSSPIFLRGETHKSKESECSFESKEITSHVTPKIMTEEILCKSEELLFQIESKEEQKLREISLNKLDTVIKEIEEIKKIKKQVEAFVEKAKRSNELIEEIELLESNIYPLDPPEKRIKIREANVVNLRKGMTELYELKENTYRFIKRYFDSNSEILKKAFPELYEKLNHYYEWIRNFEISKHIDYFTIRELAESDARHYMFGIKKDQYLIYGHTHDVYVDRDKKVANTGCWGVQDDPKNKKFLYLEIIDDDVNIMSFIGKNRDSEKWKSEDS